MAETIFLKGEGGLVWPFDLPLPDGIQSRLDRQELVRVNEDGSSFDPESAVEPKRLTPKEALQADAEALGLDVDGTKDELTARIDAKVAELLTQAAELEIDAENLTSVDLAAAIEAKLAE